MSRHTQPRHPVPDHIPAVLHEAFATAEGSDIPPHSPYQRGDAVQQHGFPGEPAGHRQSGFRGWAVATLGATILTGITTTGEAWAEYWGRLEPDGLPLNPWRWCTCCREARHAHFASQRAREAAAGQQLDLFEAVTR